MLAGHFFGGGIGIDIMAVKEHQKTITVVRGPMATGKTKTGGLRFSFCAYAKRRTRTAKRLRDLVIFTSAKLRLKLNLTERKPSESALQKQFCQWSKKAI